MPVYNAAASVATALESILAQTFQDFELLVIDDGSTDHSAQIINTYGDPRIRFMANDRNLGVIRTLNKGLDLAQGVYVARMDADDISLPERLERQVGFMDRNPKVGACGTWVETFGDRPGGVWQFPVASEEIHAHLLFHSVLAHPSVCLRRDAFVGNGLLYDEQYPHAEDFQLWQRASECFPLANLSEVLLKYNFHSDSVSRTNQATQAHTLRRIDKEALLRLGIDATDAELNLHRCLAFGGERLNAVPIEEAESWLRRLIAVNDSTARCYSSEALRRVCGELWLKTCRAVQNSDRHATRFFLSSSLSREVDLRKRAAFAVRGACSALRFSRR